MGQDHKADLTKISIRVSPPKFGVGVARGHIHTHFGDFGSEYSACYPGASLFSRMISFPGFLTFSPLPLRRRMYAETSEKKSHARIAFALLCGLAVCCSVMYVTADGSDEFAHEIVKGYDAGSSVGSTDVLKAGQIYSETPDG